MSAPGQGVAAVPPRAGDAQSRVQAHGGAPFPPPRGQPSAAVEQLRAQVVAAHHAWRATALLRLGVASSDRMVVFGRGPLPFIKNVSQLHDSHVFEGQNHRALLHDVSMPTALERADGNWERVISQLGGPSLSASVDELAAAFDTHIMPAVVRPRTREGHYR